MAKKKQVKVYFGAPLFNEMELNYNKFLVSNLRNYFGEFIDIYVPQENASINNKSNYADSLDIFEGDVDKLKETDVLIAILDGPIPDPGLSSEIGYFARMIEEEEEGDYPKTILGLYTDTRQLNPNEEKVKALGDLGESQFSYINLFVVGAVKKYGKLLPSSDSLYEELKQYLLDNGF